MTRNEGWNWLWNSRKWHWFGADGRALCGRFMILGPNAEAQTSGDDSLDNCAECRRRKKRIETTKGETDGVQAGQGRTEGS